MLHYNQMLILTRGNSSGKGVLVLDLWRFTVSTTSEASDAVSAVLDDLVVHAIEIEDVRDMQARTSTPFGEWLDVASMNIPPEGAFVHAYVMADSNDEMQAHFWQLKIETTLEAVKNSGLTTGSLAITHTFIPEDSYLHAWRDYYHTIEVTDRLAIVPAWEIDEWQGKVGQCAIIMEPGLAFGTGTHETTLLCMRALEPYVTPHSSVLDVGTGTGVLAIAAAKFGANDVLALDLDPLAVQVARENCKTNHVQEKVTVMPSDLLAAVPSKTTFDVVTANLLLGIVKKMLPDIASVLKPGGYLIASGIVASQATEAMHAMTEYGFSGVQVWQEHDWVALVGHLKE